MSEREKWFSQLIEEILLLAFPKELRERWVPLNLKVVYDEDYYPKDEFIEMYPISEFTSSDRELYAWGVKGKEKQQHFTKGVQTKKQFFYFVDWVNEKFPRMLYSMLELWCYDVYRAHPKNFRKELEKIKWRLEKKYLEAKLGLSKSFAWPFYPDYIKLIDIFSNAPYLFFGKVPEKNIFQHKGLKINEKKFSSSHLKMLYTLLKESQLIDQSTALEDFLGIFTGKMLHDMPSIRWGSEKPLQVVYLVKRLNEIELLTPKDRINWTALNHCFLKPDGKKFNFKRQYGYKFSDRAIERDGSPLSQSDVQKIDNIVKQIEKAVDTHP